MQASGNRDFRFYALLLVGLLVIAGALFLAARGLPGLQNTPTATVDGRSVVGKTGN